ncbi:hypothetical protein BCV70DRAFT_33297 [Testicularia cyperi]|uniref:Methyltransferase domain-containing protein n=1 Tax=Testicularia cyperi TaxID=1882483 RepID=A0A317XJL7_9BASI|nr:hypothetical protein BCV70DRAFT_33297 [Testicularia cyperi]
MSRQAKSPGISYHDQGYWDERFTSDPRETKGFEWLSSGNELFERSVEIISAQSEKVPSEQTKILHIGVGTSSLSIQIVRWLHATYPQDWRQRASRIVNVDFSPLSIKFQRQLERDFLKEISESEQRSDHDFIDGTGREQDDLMVYHVVDLLNYKNVQDTLGKCCFHLILDKSTTDSISTAPDLTSDEVVTSVAGKHHADVYKLASSYHRDGAHVKIPWAQILALNLHCVAVDDATWLCHSYSSDRWQDSVQNAEGTLWCWVQKSKLPVAVPNTSADVNAPALYHYIYEMRMTDEPQQTSIQL